MTKAITHISHKRVEGRSCVAFTLIELLVVISIIMMLTITAVANFSFVQQRMRLDFAADTLVSSLREAQVLAKSGRRVKAAGAASSGSAAEPVQNLQCYAVKIVSGVEAGSGLYTGQSDYVGVPKGVTSSAQVDTCELIGNDKWVKAEIFDGRSIIVGDGAVQTFYFKPPFAQIYTEEGGALVKVKNKNVMFSIGNVSDLKNPETLKKVEFDLSTGAVKRG